MRWSAQFLRFSLRILIIAVRRRDFSCLILFLWIAGVFFGFGMLAVFFWGMWVVSVGVGGWGRGQQGVSTFYICSFTCLFWWKYGMELKGGFFWNYLLLWQVYSVFVLNGCGADALCVLLVLPVVAKFMANNKGA